MLITAGKAHKNIDGFRGQRGTKSPLNFKIQAWYFDTFNDYAKLQQNYT